MMATLKLNVDLGNFSGALGSAETLPNGNYVFTSGFPGANNSGAAPSMEVYGERKSRA